MRWTKEMDAILIKLHAEGHSFSIIGHRIGVGRNSAIGRAYRMGLSQRGHTVHVRSAALDRRFKDAKPEPAKKVSLLPVEPLPAEDTPPAKLIALVDLEPHHCRWIYGDPKAGEHGFCPEHKYAGLPYCPTHVRRAYRPIETKTKVNFIPLAAKVFA